MPIGNDNYLTEVDIRVWMRDKDPSMNLLLDDLEFTPEEIRQAMTFTVDYWNEQPPIMRGYDYDKFPYRFALLCGTAAHLMFMAAMRFRRNALQYNAGGLQIADQEKYQAYDQAGGMWWTEFKKWVADKKRSLNAEIGWASLS